MPRRPADYSSADPFGDLEALVETLSRRSTCRACPGSRAGRSATPLTTPSATPSTCPNVPPDDRGLPDLSFAFYDRMVIFDHIRKTVLVVAQAHVGPGADPQGRYDAGLRPGRRAGRAAGRARSRARR